MSDNSWYNIILDNWSQIIVLLIVVWYFITRIVTWRYKKKEIKYQRIQEEKIKEIKSFYKSILNLEVALKRYFYQTEFGIHDDEIFKALKKDISDCHLDFEYHFRILRLYLNKEEIAVIKDLNDTLSEIGKDITKWHIYKNTDQDLEVNLRLVRIREEVLPKTIPDLLLKLEEKLRSHLFVK